MKYGFVLPLGDARKASEVANEAEKAGWDGFFVWEPVWGVDAWVSLTAAAMVTKKIRLGTMLSPVSRMRPWKLASEAATLDKLSNGRVILSVGLGAVDTGFKEFGEETSRVKRAELLDEGLDIITGLWRGQPFNYSGKHYSVREIKFFPPPSPVQEPRIPIWVVGAWPKEKSMRRVLRYDGLLPDKMVGKRHVKVEADDVREMIKWISENRENKDPFDVVIEGETKIESREDWDNIIEPWIDAGATWWLESMWGYMDHKNAEDELLRRVQLGPPSKK